MWLATRVDARVASPTLHLHPSRLELAQRVVPPDEMADIVAYELDLVIRQHFANPLRPFHVLLSANLAIDIGIGRRRRRPRSPAADVVEGGGGAWSARGQRLWPVVIE